MTTWQNPTVSEPSEEEAREARKAYWIGAITAWTTAAKEARIEQSMSREELAELDSLQRLVCQRQSLIDNLARYYRERPLADVAPGLLALITFLSDNDSGSCTLSVR